MAVIRSAMLGIARKNQPQNNRNLFYSLVSAMVIQKLEPEYKNVVLRLCLKLRESGLIPWEWIVDETRFYSAPTTYTSARDALRATAIAYRQSLWTTGDINVQVWCESLSAAAVVKPVTHKWDVRLYPLVGIARTTSCETLDVRLPLRASHPDLHPWRLRPERQKHHRIQHA
jgi:hypothetical protein